MAIYDLHLKCAQCREKGIGDDPCVAGKDCELCNSLSPEQLKQLATPTYKIRKEKCLSDKGLVDPSTVTVLKAANSADSKLKSSPVRPACAPVSSQLPTGQSLDIQKQMDSLQEEWATRFAHLEALLTLGSHSAEKPVFSPVKLQVPHSAASVVVSDPPFFDSGAGTSGPAAPAEDLDEPVPVHSEQDMSMKSPLADLYSPGPVHGDQELVFNTGRPDPFNSSTI